MNNATHIAKAENVRDFCIRACLAVGVSPGHAALIAEHLVQAELRGIQTHGIARLPDYIVGYQKEKINRSPSVRIVQEAQATAVMDGDCGLGLVVSHPAMALAVKKAAEYGIGAVTMRNSNHFGFAAYWSMLALPHDMIGYATTNANPTMAPWGGKTLRVGNNPLSYAVPAGQQLPIVTDMATSVAAYGKIMLAALADKPIPPGWAMNADGEPTTDAREAAVGLLMPVAGHKGYGLALIGEVLCGVLSGGNFSTDVTGLSSSCHFFMAIDISRFMPVDEFKDRVDRLALMMKDTPLAPGHDRIYLPGEIEFETHKKRSKEGIPYPPELMEQIEKLAHDLNIPINL